MYSTESPKNVSVWLIKSGATDLQMACDIKDKFSSLKEISFPLWITQSGLAESRRSLIFIILFQNLVNSYARGGVKIFEALRLATKMVGKHQYRALPVQTEAAHS